MIADLAIASLQPSSHSAQLQQKRNTPSLQYSNTPRPGFEDEDDDEDENEALCVSVHRLWMLSNERFDILFRRQNRVLQLVCG
jgi:hypothetical protein